MGRHRGPDVPAVTPRFPWLLWWFAGFAIVLVAGSVAMIWHGTWEPAAHAAEVPQPPKVTQPAPVAGPVQPIFDDLPPGFPAFDGVPYDGGKEPVAVVVSKATKIATSSRVPSRTPVARVPVAAEREPITSQTEPAPVIPPPADDPLTDDGTFGDGCEQPGTRERCDPDVPPVGLPPVVVVETPPVVVAEEPPATPAEEEPPVDEVEVVEPETEVAG